jgi:hypothetical protein
MTLNEILPHLLYEFKSESDLIKAIEELSEKFTKNREKIGDYLRDPRLVSAYSVFYLLTNLPKLEQVLSWMPGEWVKLLLTSDLIDLGAGPGTFSFAWKNLGGRGQIYQVEHSELMRDQAKKLWSGFHQSELFQSPRWAWKTPSEKLLLFGHSANEMGVKTALGFIQEISPEHILFVEPGTKDFFPKMLEMRKHLLENGYHVLYPCPLSDECPMASTSDWCHQFISVKHDPEVERLSQMARKDRRLLPLTVQAFSRTFSPVNPTERLVRVLPETKFSFEWEVCHSNRLERYQVMKRDLTRGEINELSQVLAGASLETEILKVMGQGIRVKVRKVN